jgi:hypothetical protein
LLDGLPEPLDRVVEALLGDLVAGDTREHLLASSVPTALAQQIVSNP